MKKIKGLACLPLVLVSTFCYLQTNANAATHSLEWTEQLGTSSLDESSGVSADGLGNVYISGFTSGNLGGPNAGGWDAFVAKISDPIPEPSSLALLLSACVGWASVGRRRVKLPGRMGSW
ncbi:MAG: PEP-CTERM sorting domain-containing protein [Planctomycetes bacterium]|nr:PEP-CTERM sorting domain-containing protein [Planctomycetota bacterium]